MDRSVVRRFALTLTFGGCLALAGSACDGANPTPTPGKIDTGGGDVGDAGDVEQGDA